MSKSPPYEEQYQIWRQYQQHFCNHFFNQKLTRQNSQRLYLLGRTSRRFLWCWLLLLFHLTGGFSFIVFRRHPSPFHELSPSFYTYFIFSAQFIAEWFVPFSFELFRIFLSQLYRERYGFALFTHKLFLPCTPFPHFDTFLWLRYGQKHHIQDPPLCLPSQSCPFRLTHGLEQLIL